MRHLLIKLHFLLYLAILLSFISANLHQLKKLISQEDHIKIPDLNINISDLNEKPRDNPHTENLSCSQKITLIPVVKNFDESKESSEDKSNLSSYFKKCKSFPVEDLKPSGEVLFERKFISNNYILDTPFQNKEDDLMLNQIPKKLKQEAIPLSKSSNLSLGCKENTQISNTIPKMSGEDQEVCVKTEEKRIHKSTARGGKSPSFTTKMAYQIEGRDTQDKKVDVEEANLDISQIKTSKETNILFKVYDWNFIREEPKGGTQEDHQDHFFRFLNRCKEEKNLECFFSIQRGHSGLFWNNYLSSKKKLSTGKEIKKEIRKTYTMKTLLRNSDKKINLEANPLFSKELVQKLQKILETNFANCVDPTPTPQIKTILQFVKDITKTAHFLIIIYLSLFKQHREEVFTLYDSENILEFLNKTWFDIHEDSPELSKKEWAIKVSKLFKFQNFKGRNDYMFTQKKYMHKISCHLLVHWIEKTGRCLDYSRGNQKRDDSMLVGLINLMIFHSNYETIFKDVKKENSKISKKRKSEN
ncbi:hypothetical protein PGT21_030807 [Puccinia graminis f. sp. tritici]|uniref:Golgi to ER traffic-protein n=1 Tax=Puccinia graminis f. sp. tritici TaxID=56615 RepID=A0A5B0MRI6_PUCGR|nr:hypothetical protein PGT21_030807 [Puccinia graminis f. sp. tritici]KAA1078550.1 hypothetical protein PGTUg99_012030 [Puccinia graminis f. sp. tritici]